MMNVQPVRRSSAMAVIQAVTLSKEVLEASLCRIEHRANGSVPCTEDSSRLLLSPPKVGARSLVRRNTGLCEVIRQIEERSRRFDGECTRGIEAEEIHAGPVAHADVGANVDLGKLRQPTE